MTTDERLEYLRGAIEAERISMGEIIELESLGEQGLIPEGDVTLREWAGLPEFPEGDSDDVVSITGTITLRDGSTSEFSIDLEYGWSQWGATEARLYKTVPVLEEMTRGLAEG